MARTARKKLIIEARINEYMTRDANPNGPWTPDDTREMRGMACGRRGRCCGALGHLSPIPHRLYVAWHPQEDPAADPGIIPPQSTRS